jgi:hypothetical protein
MIPCFGNQLKRMSSVSEVFYLLKDVDLSTSLVLQVVIGCCHIYHSSGEGGKCPQSPLVPPSHAKSHFAPPPPGKVPFS